MDNSRALIAFLVSIGVMILYLELLQWRYPQHPPEHAKQAEMAKKPGASKLTSAQKGPASVVLPPEVQPTPGTVAPGAPSGPRSGPHEMTAATMVAARRIEVDTNFYHAVITSVGARMVSFRLKRYKETDSPNSPLYEMLRPGQRLPMGLEIVQDNERFDDAGLGYTTNAPSRIEVKHGQHVTLTFVGTTQSGVKLEKSFTFSDSSYVFQMSAHASAPSDSAKISRIGVTFSQPLTELPGFRDYPELQAYVSGKVLTEDQKPLEQGIKPVAGKITYAGFGDRYFLAAFLPKDPENGTLEMSYSDKEANTQLLFDQSSFSTRVFMGPKELDLLEATNPDLSKAIDFGYTGIIALPFLRALQFLHRIAPNYGVAIILLTIIVRLLTLPMSIKGQRSMLKMQRLQPQVERIRERFKDDQERLNREMVELYKRNHVNPLGGCLPMAIQLPILWGLYEALLNAVELRQAPFIGWIKDLSAPDCLPVSWIKIPFTDLHGIPVLVLLMAATAFIQQWMSPRQPDPSQQKIMMYMPVVFSLIFIDLPAGLSLYYFASNLLGIVQQFFLNREFKQYTPVT